MKRFIIFIIIKIPIIASSIFTHSCLSEEEEGEGEGEGDDDDDDDDDDDWPSSDDDDDDDHSIHLKCSGCELCGAYTLCN